MALEKLKSKFMEAYEGRKTQFVPFDENDRFPYEKLSLAHKLESNTIFYFISMTCATCMRLVPELRRFNGNNRFILVTDGDQEETADMREYFGFEFPIYSYLEDYDEHFNVPVTPFVYVVNADGQVVEYGNGEQLDQIAQVLNSEGDTNAE
ncbi:hypothetical protein DFQ01_10612 [Paenibacillus cellulosilyticus]|uniref:Thioredoxin domain-containing protein n=1 Tax=Paenibacillus cellulosilyticus TaxID=375489 RepID=A0A2V2YUA1_9BACL|nr:hypothetical protein [Paenibacillus cellulosilyticus]PWW04731.1 hypothetical protein DFQ01_10612 [Paenibacillus cellulosilyticus]QKS45856.1 hypothetical protein HUB94_16465 [Paenibacillus cellulosilyticus]